MALSTANVYITGDLYWSKVVALRSPSRVVSCVGRLRLSSGDVFSINAPMHLMLMPMIDGCIYKTAKRHKRGI